MNVKILTGGRGVAKQQNVGKQGMDGSVNSLACNSPTYLFLLHNGRCFVGVGIWVWVCGCGFGCGYVGWWGGGGGGLPMRIYFCEKISTCSFLVLAEPLRIAVTPGPEVEVSMDTQVEFSCSLACACSGNITLTWTRPGADLPLSAIITRIDPRRVTLNFRATAQEAGLYRCTASRSRTVPAVEEVRLVVQ